MLHILKNMISSVLAGGLLLLGANLPAVATDFDPPKAEVLLTVDGLITSKNGPVGLDLDLAMLKDLPVVTFQTTTQWTDGIKTFTGVPLKALVEAAGATGTIVCAKAINDYSIDIPITDLEDNAPIIAYEIDGETFSRREKGPLWIVYPYDLGEKYNTEKTFGNSIWQLVRLTVE